LQLAVQGGLVGLYQQVVGVLVGDQPIGVLTLGVEGVGGDDGVGEVQTLQQRPEPGDLVGGVVHVGLGRRQAAPAPFALDDADGAHPRNTP
jgi:hypothetical protein